jgi:hypothetical protein
MKAFVFGVATAALLALTSQAGAQVGVRVGPDGVGVRLGDRVGDRDRGEYRDHDRYRDRDDWRFRRHRGDCDAFWRDGHRVTVCHR